jgi:hypothetical protein
MTPVEEAHEHGHYKVGQYYCMEPVLEEREVRYRVPSYPSLEACLACLVAGAVNQHLHFPESHLTSGCGVDGALCCEALHGTNPVAYGVALACIVAGSNARFVIPQEHQELLKAAVQTARDILKE